MTDKNPDRRSQNPADHLDAANPAPPPDPAPAPGMDVAGAHAELASLVLNEHSLTAILHRVAELAVSLLPDLEEVSITLIEGSRLRTVAFSGDRAQALDERQYADGYGPCTDAALTGKVITIEDTAHSRAYPGFGGQAHRYGIHRTLSIPLPALQHTSGALNMYAGRGAGPFTRATHDTATSFAGYAAVAMLNSALYSGALREAAQLRTALVSRAGIDQAKGILMRQRGYTPEEAFNALRDIASRSNRKLRDVAQDVINDNGTSWQPRSYPPDQGS